MSGLKNPFLVPQLAQQPNVCKTIMKDPKVYTTKSVVNHGIIV